MKFKPYLLDDSLKIKYSKSVAFEIPKWKPYMRRNGQIEYNTRQDD